MKNLLNRLNNQFRYGGLTREVFREISAMLNEENYYMLVRISGASALVGILMIVLVRLGVVRNEALPAYLVLVIPSAVVFLTAVFYIVDHKSLVMPVLFFQLMQLVIYSLMIGTVLTNSPESYAVTFSAVIVLIPFLIIAPPLPVFLLLLASNLLVIWITPFFKTADAISMDIVNAVTFSVIAACVQFVYSNRAMRRIAGERFMSMDHDLDSLTGLQSEAALRSMVNMYLSRRIDGEEGAMILVRLLEMNPEETTERTDQRILSVSKLLRILSSRHELVGRIGTEEFAVFYRECSKVDAERHGDAIRQALEAESACGPTAAAVVCTRPRDTFDALYERGSEALNPEEPK